MLFIPERELPDILYTTLDKEADFDAYPHLQQYRVTIDVDGEWVSDIKKILLQFPSPRRQEERPLRTKAHVIVDEEPSASDMYASTSIPPSVESDTWSQGRRLYAEAMTQGHRSLFFNFLAECAQRYKPSRREIVEG